MAKETLRTVKAVEAAENKTEAVKEQALKKERKMQQESVYSAEELASAARRVFQTTPEIVKTALKMAEEKIHSKEFIKICGECRWYKAGICSFDKWKDSVAAGN